MIQLFKSLVCLVAILSISFTACTKRDYQTRTVIKKAIASSQYNGILAPYDYNPINLFDGSEEKGKFSSKGSFCEGKESKVDKLVDRGKEEFIEISLKFPIKFNALKLYNGHASQFKTFSKPSALEISTKFNDEKKFSASQVVNVQIIDGEQIIQLKETLKGDVVRITIKNISAAAGYLEGVTCLNEVRFIHEEQGKQNLLPVSFVNQDLEQTFKEYEETMIKTVRGHLATQSYFLNCFTNPANCSKFVILPHTDVQTAENGSPFLPRDIRSERYPSGGMVTDAPLVLIERGENMDPVEVMSLKPVVNDINGIVLEGIPKNAAPDSTANFRIRFRYVNWRDAQEEFKNQDEYRKRFEGLIQKEKFTLYFIEVFNETGGTTRKTLYLFGENG